SRYDRSASLRLTLTLVVAISRCYLDTTTSATSGSLRRPMIRGVGHSFGRPRHYGRMHPPLPVPPHDENQLSHVRFSIDPRMGAILSGIRDSPFASDVGNRIARLVVEADPSPTGPSLAEALRPHLWLL